MTIHSDMLGQCQRAGSIIEPFGEAWGRKLSARGDKVRFGDGLRIPYGNGAAHPIPHSPGGKCGPRMSAKVQTWRTNGACPSLERLCLRGLAGL
jgi:hypothetical protein